MKIKLLPFAVAAVGAALFATGCSTVNTVEPAQPAGVRQGMVDKRVITDPSLNRGVHILAVNTTDTPAGFLKIQIEVRNETSSLKSFTYRVEWFDQAGMALHMATDTSVSRSIEGKETMDIVALAPTATAKDFKVTFLQSAN
jgi:uncharacterized protein YcfL